MTTHKAGVRCGRSAPGMKKWRPALAGIAVVVSAFATLTAFAGTASAAPTGEATTTTVTATPKTSTIGDPVTYSALVKAVSGFRPISGTVTFTVGSQLCSATVLFNRDGTNRARCRSAVTPVGNSTVTARYSGDPNFAPSAGTTTVTVNPRVGRIPTTTSVSATPTGRNQVTYLATVTPASSIRGLPTGTVTFVVGTTQLCTARLRPRPPVGPTPNPSASYGECTSNNPPAATQPVTGTYSGDARFAASSGSATFTPLQQRHRHRHHRIATLPWPGGASDHRHQDVRQPGLPARGVGESGG